MRKRVDFVIGYFYHIYNRGVDKKTIFGDESDYMRFMEYLYFFNDDKPAGGPSSEERDKLVEVLCFQLMPNHFHLILTPKKDNGIVKFMRKCMTGYAMYYNKKYKRTGVLFETRYKAKLIDSDAYFCHLTRYIHLNCLELVFPDWEKNGIPKWEKAVQFLKNYKWSSLSFYLYQENPYGILCEDLILNHLEIGLGEKYLNFLKEWEDGPRDDKETFCSK